MNIEQTFSNLVDKLTGWVEAFVLMLPNLVAAVLIVVAFWLAARLVRKMIMGLMGRVSTHYQVNKLLATIGYVAVLAAGTFIALGVLELDKAVTSLLAGAGIIGLALGFAFQDIAANFISGILMSVRRPFGHGDIIKTNDFFGTVSDVNLRTTTLRTFQGQDVLIPNKEVFQNPLVNYSTTPRQRIDLACGVAYGDDLDEAQRVAVEALDALDMRDRSRDVEFFYESFGDSSINFVARFWIDFKKQTDFLHARSEAIKRLKHAFDDHGITIPFPIRTLDFGVVGGEKLSEVLPERFYAPANQRDNGSQELSESNPS